MDLKPEDLEELSEFLKDKVPGLLLDAKTYYGSNVSPRDVAVQESRQESCKLMVVKLNRWAAAIEKEIQIATQIKIIYEYDVSMYINSGRRDHKSGFNIIEHKIAVQNDRMIVLNSEFFTQLDKKGKSYIRYVLNRHDITCRTGDTTIDDLLGRGVFYKLYTAKKVRRSTIEKQIKDFIRNKYGWLTSDLDYSIFNEVKK